MDDLEKTLTEIIKLLNNQQKEIEKKLSFDFKKHILAPIIVSLILGFFAYFSGLINTNYETKEEIKQIKYEVVTIKHTLNYNTSVISDALKIHLKQLD